MPVFNDWVSFGRLLEALNRFAPGWHAQVDVIAVDDGSMTQQELSSVEACNNLHEVSVVSLACNLGHQRAIAVGMAEVHRRGEHDICIVMDCDGEDRPEDIAALLEGCRVRPATVIAARRGQRSEHSVVPGLLCALQATFRVLTGQSIDFGNFCLVPKVHLTRLVHMTELWNHLAGSVIRSRLPLHRVESERGHRYAGTSR